MRQDRSSTYQAPKSRAPIATSFSHSKNSKLMQQPAEPSPRRLRSVTRKEMNQKIADARQVEEQSKSKSTSEVEKESSDTDTGSIQSIPSSLCTDHLDSYEVLRMKFKSEIAALVYQGHARLAAKMN